MMSKKFLKTIAIASTISLTFLGATGTAWGMWDELEEQDRHRIIKAHILDITKPGEYRSEIRGRGENVQIFVPHVPIHTGGWIDNWPELTIEKTCSTCKQDITTTYNTEVVPKQMIQLKNDNIRLQIELENLKLKNKQ